MATNATYIPVLGDFSAPFSIVSQDASAVPRNTAIANIQGAWRPGKIRWIFDLNIPDATTPATDDQFTIQVPSPYAFTAADIGANENSFWPSVVITPRDSGVIAEQVSAMVMDGSSWSVANQTVAVLVVVNAPGGALLNIGIDINFSHTMIS